jgi:glycosyltransferase involved in cell wall biosynthesis
MSIYANLVVGGINSPAMKTKMIISERNDPRHDHISIKSKILRKLLYHRADFFVFQTKQEQQYYSKSIQKRSVIIHNMLKEDLPYRSQINAKKEIVAVGRFLPQKNYPMLLSAVKMVFEKHPQYILKIYGKGPLEKELKMKVTELGINDHVFFEGFHLDVHECMKDADIFVMSSDFEGLPNALMEAMAMGFPVVTTNCPAGGPEELITDGVNGMLVPVGDSQAMAEKINYLIENKEIKEEMGRKAVGIRETHTSEHICAAWRAILEA